jgi:hypothetical protein
MGGWSIGFHREGFDCIGIDIVDVGYPYHFIQSDIREYHYPMEVKPDVMVISPPCTEFSTMTQLSWFKKQRGPPDPKGPNGLGLVEHGIRVMKEASPRYWVLENVYGSREYIEPLLGKPRVEAKPFLLWGNFPEVLWPDKKHLKSFNQETPWGREYLKRYGKFGMVEDFPFDPLRAWKRARIPVWVSQHVAKACREELSLKVRTTTEKP